MNLIHSHSFRQTAHEVGADYRLRLSSTFKHMAVVGIVALLTAFVTGYFQVFGQQPVIPVILLILGIVTLAPAVLVAGIIHYAQNWRFRLRDRMVNTIPWRGDEQVLDIGTGNGILLIGCAKRLTTGKATGIDIWDANAGGGSPELFWKNVHSEGVQAQAELQNVDARHMPFENDSFDVIVSSFAFHHIGSSAAAREPAVREMLRVLKPGGYVTLFDVSVVMNPTASDMRRLGFEQVQFSGKRLGMLTARKAG
jgi:arsenite methyltransferase